MWRSAARDPRQVIRPPGSTLDLYFYRGLSAMLISKHTAVVSFLAAVTLLGCGGHVTEYRYLDEISSYGSQDVYMHEGGQARLERGKELDKVWVDPDFNIVRYRKIYIKPMEIAPGLMDEEQSSKLAEYFAESLRDAIKGRLLLRVITAEEGPLPEKTLVLETGLAQLDKSSKLTNWGTLLAMGYPVDPTHVQVEGRIKDAKTDETLFVFADNRVGRPLFGSDEETWEEHIADIAGDLVLELATIKVKMVR